MSVKRLETLVLILFPLIAFIIVMVMMGEATSGMNDAWMEGTKP